MKKYVMGVVLAGLFAAGACTQSSSQNIGDLQEATVKVANSAGKAVVSISSEVRETRQPFFFESPFGGNREPFERFFEEFFGEMPQKEYRRQGLGSGVIIDREGHILTNAHVVDGAESIKVKLSDGREFDAEISGTDLRSDLAVIQINAGDLPVARLGDSDQLQIGAWVVAIGNPFGFAIENPEPTVTVGVVSALHRFLPALGRRKMGYDDLIQTDAAINPGNSGGPLVNLDGEVIGINTAIITTTGGYQGLGFAIPVNKAKRVISKLIQGEKVLYGWLGISIQDLNEDLRNYFNVREQKGVIVVRVIDGSPADKAGLKEGDLILSFGGENVKATRELVRMVSATEVGTTVAVGILREGQRKQLRVKVGKMPKDIGQMAAYPEKELMFRGMSVENITPRLQRSFRIEADQGVVITDIEPDSPADRAGLRVGYVIQKIEGTLVENVTDFRKVTKNTKGRALIKTNRGYFVIKE
ncbi:MAG: Do family serine endopeptidase [Candidatus Omnitrophica bacterium]|nr:Do family serine endopeptidase [Candidatus Omnitrophota bacterium]